MGCFCGSGEGEHEEAVVTRRRCRDLPFLLFFLALCGGMVYVAVQAFKQGDPHRLYYGIDSYGNVCGSNNNWNRENGGPDLTASKKLFFLNPFELQDPLQYQYAKAICVPECPSAADVCSITDIPCLSAAQYRCPYYSVAEDGLAGTLQGVDDPWSVSYFGQLASTSASCDLASGLVPGAIKTAFDGAAPAGASACGVYYQAQSQIPGEGPCYAVFTESVEIMNRCLPKFPPQLAETFIDSGLGALTGASLNNNRDRLQRYIADIGRGLYVILAAGLGVALVLSVVWVVLLRFFSGLMAWLTMLAANLLFAGCTLLSYQKAGMLTGWGSVGAYISQELGDLGQAADPSEADRQQWAYVAYTLSGLSGLLLLASLVMIPRVKIAVAVLKVASQAVAHVPSIFFFPLLPFLATAGFTAYWCVVAAYLYSAGTITPHYRDVPSGQPTSTLTIQDLLNLQSGSIASISSLNTSSLAALNAVAPPFDLNDENCANSPNCYYSIDWDTQQKYLFIYHLFSALWVYQFIVGFGNVSIAGAVAHYYWSGGDSSRMPRAPLLGSAFNALTYHLGSIAFGSFIIAVMQFVRLIFEWVAARVRTLQEKAGLKYVVWIIRGVLWLLEQVLKFINRNAFIMVAVKGTSYCTSAGRATVLIVANALRVGAVNLIGDFLIFLGKLAVAAGCGVAALLLTNLDMFSNPVTYPDTYLSSPLLPVAVSVLAGFTVAHVFFSVYVMAVDTVLLCFCEDCESHNGHPMYAPELLLDALGLAREAASKGKVADNSQGAFIVSKAGGGGSRAKGQPQPVQGDWEIGSRLA